MVSAIAVRFRLLRLLGRAGPRPAALLVVLQTVRAVVPVAQALAVGGLVAALFAARTVAEAAVAAGLVAGLFLLDQVVWLLIVPVRTLVVRRIDGDLRARVRAVATAVPGLDVLESVAFQDRVSRAVDTGSGVGRERSAGGAAAGQLELVLRMVSTVAATALVATLSVVLAVGLLALGLVLRAVIRRQWMRLVDMLDADTVSQRYDYYVSSQAVYFAAKDVRLFGLADWFAGRTRAAIARIYAPVWRELLAALRRQWWTAVLALAGATAVLAAPAVAVLRGDLDPALLITYVLAGTAVLAISATAVETFDIEYGRHAVAAADELSTLYGAGSVADVAGPAARPPTVRFENVVFSYPGEATPTLDGLTVTLHPGQTVAMVGANGAGKTTFVKLLAGLYRPDSGRITVDGVEPHLRRPPLTVLFQDFVRYPASLRDNVTAAAPGHPVDDDAVRDHLRRAGAADLPADIDTLLWREGTDGTDLSGGQWQRVGLARVLFAVTAGRRLLVLDEPTASLDVRAEAEFHEQVVAGVRDATTLLISHRMSTVRFADRILLLRDGRVVEDGTHDDLLALGGGYARFFTAQAAAFRGEPA
ncbi:ABC transporter ATP-binding protein [Virgisporangium ochraceum]